MGTRVCRGQLDRSGKAGHEEKALLKANPRREQGGRGCFFRRIRANEPVYASPQMPTCTTGQFTYTVKLPVESGLGLFGQIVFARHHGVVSRILELVVERLFGVNLLTCYILATQLL